MCVLAITLPSVNDFRYILNIDINCRGLNLAELTFQMFGLIIVFDLSSHLNLPSILCLISLNCMPQLPSLPHFVLSSYVVPGERAALLSRLSHLLTSSSPHIGVHFEMASFVEESIMEDLLQYVISYVCMTPTYDFLPSYDCLCMCESAQ